MAKKVPIRRGTLTGPEKRPGHKVLLAVAVIAAFALGAYSEDAGRLQKHVFPKRYWSRQIKTLQDDLQHYNKLAADNLVLLREANMKAKLAVGQVLHDTGYSQEVIDANRDEIEETERDIAAMYLKDAREIAGYLDELMRYTQGKLAEAARELGKRQGILHKAREGER